MDALRILICDDEQGMRMGVTRSLRNFTIPMPDMDESVGVEVIEAETGERALEYIHEEPPEILLLDHKLPGMSGLDVLEQIGDAAGDMRTIMITAYASIETAVRATKQGAFDFLPKPFTPAELKSAIEKAAQHLLIAREAKKLASEKRQVRFELISVVAHELKAPINAVEGYLNLLNSEMAGTNPETHAQILERCAIRISGMRKLITDLLDMTRLESGQKPRELEKLNLQEIATTAFETLIPDAQARGIQMNLHATSDETLYGDASEIEIIFNNLISNAVKYNRDNGQVDVTISRDADAVVIRVKDTGIGMTKKESAKLFHDFVRIRNSKTTAILGSGLGLSILKKIAKLYGGQVAVESTPDVGSTFTVTLYSTENGEHQAA